MKAVDPRTIAGRAFVRSLNILLKFARLYGFDHVRTKEQLGIAWHELSAAIPPANDAGLLLGASGSQLKSALSSARGIRINEICFVATDSRMKEAGMAAQLAAVTLGDDSDQFKRWLNDPQKLLEMIAAAQGSKGAGTPGTGIGAGNGPGIGIGIGTGTGGLADPQA